MATSYTYSDGGGNVVQIMVEAENGLVPEKDDGDVVLPINWVSSTDRWVGNGRTIVNNKGQPVKQYEPFFKHGREYETDKNLVEWGVSPTLRYDAAGRQFRTDSGGPRLGSGRRSFGRLPGSASVVDREQPD